MQEALQNIRYVNKNDRALIKQRRKISTRKSNIRESNIKKSTTEQRLKSTIKEPQNA